MNNVTLSIGGNLGNRMENIRRALDYIEERIGKIKQRSSVYESEPWGFEAEHRFLNAVVVAETALSPEVVLREAQEIENIMGRIRSGSGYSSRTMDIDILFFNDDIINTPTLTVPHPRLHERHFVLLPLAEIMPDRVHPVLRESVKDLLAIPLDVLSLSIP
ncbi:MAG: 2-amino-4-hydroxy-6-hydroxymethyldihydropteridine diphosphokinase [Bacteroidales bacterium]|nr:2-amino-4-hydroxy-6-hydroxymethyldihydropteridine diphosphokinase [Bacteroidales bacterium]